MQRRSSVSVSFNLLNASAGAACADPRTANSQVEAVNVQLDLRLVNCEDSETLRNLVSGSS
jgi:hypothetical protein